MTQDKKEDRALGMECAITRRDFLNTLVLGAGAALAGAACPMHAMAAAVKSAAAGDAAALPLASAAARAFDGFGGIGDYAASHGNTYGVMSAAHAIRDGLYDSDTPVSDDGEVYDLVVVGGGLCGMMAVYRYTQLTGGSKRCLILENHPIFGGAAKQNVVEVDGTELIGPQASNDFLPPPKGSGTQEDWFFSEFDIPREYRFQGWDQALKQVRLSPDNYNNMDGLAERKVDVAYFFGARDGAGKPGWQRNIWDDDLARTPFTPQQRHDLLRWRADYGTTGENDPRVLDTMTYQHFLENVKGYDPMVTRFAQPVVGLLGGVGADAVSARVGNNYVTDGSRLTYSFPGGNAVLGCYLVNGLVPGTVGGNGLEGMIHGAVDLGRLDRAGQPTRIRVGATAVRVNHAQVAGRQGVVVDYEKGGKLQRVHGRAVVMASGGWVNRRVLGDMPDTIREAYQAFSHAPALVANVALRNWRFLYNMGAGAMRWVDDGTMFGFCANIRRHIMAGGYAPELHPDKPAMLTFYMGLYTPGHDARTQGIMGRYKLLSTSYADYERLLRRQMTDMLAGTGFDASRDIAGIVLNRWGHARVTQPPGFYYGQDGKPAPREIVAKGYGQVIIAHSELNGAQNYRGAFQHGIRAAEEAVALAA